MENNTRELRRDITKLLGKSDMWLVLRLDKEGAHIHTPNEEQLALFGAFFKACPELWGIVKDFVEEN